MILLGKQGGLPVFCAPPTGLVMCARVKVILRSAARGSAVPPISASTLKGTSWDAPATKSTYRFSEVLKNS
jgi:hypothetical protein